MLSVQLWIIGSSNISKHLHSEADAAVFVFGNFLSQLAHTKVCTFQIVPQLNSKNLQFCICIDFLCKSMHLPNYTTTKLWILISQSLRTKVTWIQLRRYNWIFWVCNLRPPGDSAAASKEACSTHCGKEHADIYIQSPCIRNLAPLVLRCQRSSDQGSSSKGSHTV